MSSSSNDSTSATTPLPVGVEIVAPRFEAIRIGEFEIIRKLGEGSFGQVYLARQLSLGREVALKVDRHRHPSVNHAGSTTGHDDSAESSTGRNEGRLLAGLEHDHIVKVYSEFRDGETGTHGLCLQYIPGADLGTVIRHIHGEGRVPVGGHSILNALDDIGQGETGFDPVALRDRESLARDDFSQAVCRIGVQLAEALSFAHARGILHCDIKPGNILLTPYGRPMLADFNVAYDRTLRDPALAIGGTLAYMAPEHLAAAQGSEQATVDERCDVYSLGVVLHELATGKRPATPDGFRGKPTLLLDNVPRELAIVIRRCLHQNPESRYQNAAELANALTGARHLLAARRALPPETTIGRWATQRPVTALALAGLIPHIPASLLNIAYNSIEIDLNTEQKRVFLVLVAIYNLIAYPICFGTAAYLIRRIKQGLARQTVDDGQTVDALRRRVLHLGRQAALLGALGWLPGGVLFPLIIDLVAGSVGLNLYAHFLVSFTLSGLIGIIFSYLAIQAVVLRALLPYLGNPDTYSPGALQAEVEPVTVPFGPFLMLASAVPLTGAILLIVPAEGTMTLGFRLLVVCLIGLGVAGAGVAERLTTRLRSLAAVWMRESPK